MWEEIVVLDVVGAVAVSLLFIVGLSALPEPARQRYNAVFVAGAGAAYLNGGFGMVELAFALVVSVWAYLGLRSYKAIAVAWALHVVWDVLHHLYGQPILQELPTSSFGCAVCDAIWAVWFWLGAPSALLPLGKLTRARN